MAFVIHLTGGEIPYGGIIRPMHSRQAGELHTGEVER
jgi:hypothetical protein